MSQPTTGGSAPFAKAEMLVRKPVADVFEAFVNPELTARFWFSRGVGRLDAGKPVEWFWEPYGASAKVQADAIVKNELIAFTWPSNGVDATVEMRFTPYSENSTFVSITEKGWQADHENLYAVLAGQTEGWTLVLSSLKAWLEKGINIGVIFDRHPSLIKS